MTIKHFCDDCEKPVKIETSVYFRSFGTHPLNWIEMCYDCLIKHWKPIKDKFALKITYAHKI